MHCGGACGRGCAWQGSCMVGACMAGGYAWWVVCVAEGACMAGEMATAADGMYPTGMHSC